MNTTEREALIALSVSELLNWQEKAQDCAQSKKNDFALLFKKDYTVYIHTEAALCHPNV